MKDRIKAYLADGLTAAQVATIIGCSPAYISQLLKDEDFKASVQAALLDNQKPVDEVLETRYVSLEHSIVHRMQEELAGAELPHLTKALEAVTKAQDLKHKKKNPGLANNTVIQTVVSIAMPAHALPKPVLEVNAQSEVVAIDNRPLAPMSSGSVRNLFKALAEKKEQHEFSAPQHPGLAA